MEVPKCPTCKEGMVSTMSFPGKEYACLPCGTSDEFFCHNERIEVEDTIIEDKIEKWGDDMHVLGVTIGGGKCTAEDCKLCADLDNYVHKYYLQGEKQ